MSTSTLPPAFAGLVDDSAGLPGGSLPLPEAVSAYAARRDSVVGGLVRSLVVRDTDLPSVLDAGLPLTIVSTGGAGAVAGPLRLAARGGVDVRGLEIALRDLDDPAGNARRLATAVEAARDEGLLEDSEVYVELPHVGSTGSWLAAADVVAEHELRLTFRTGDTSGETVRSHALARWIDAALDRETPYRCTGGLRAVAQADGPGFLNVLLATRLAFDGVGLDEVVAVLDQRDPAALLERAAGEDLAGARRWVISFGSTSVDGSWHDLVALGLAPA